jgi:hypothetical protein
MFSVARMNANVTHSGMQTSGWLDKKFLAERNLKFKDWYMRGDEVQGFILAGSTQTIIFKIAECLSRALCFISFNSLSY